MHLRLRCHAMLELHTTFQHHQRRHHHYAPPYAAPHTYSCCAVLVVSHSYTSAYSWMNVGQPTAATIQGYSLSAGLLIV
jgi:hypothetical protein